MTQPAHGQVYRANDGQWYRWPDPTPYETEQSAHAATAAMAPGSFYVAPTAVRPVPAVIEPTPAVGWQPGAQFAADPGASRNEQMISVIAAVLTCGYFIPWAVAVSRGKSNAGAIFLINFLTGWTLIGWVVALAMACLENRPPQQPTTVVYVTQQMPGQPPYPGVPPYPGGDVTPRT